MPPPPICILYGSQTGAAKGVAEHVHASCEKQGLPSTLSPANDYEKVGFPRASLVVVVCSTTGDGDAPMNAEEFMRYIRKRAHPKDLLVGQRCAVLGLGDTNYDKFCNCAKQVVRRLGELGAGHLLPPAYADEGTGLDSTIDPWLEALFPILKAAMEEAAAVVSAAGDAPAAAATPAATPAAAHSVPSAALASADTPQPPATVPPATPAELSKTLSVDIPPEGKEVDTPVPTMPQSPMAMMQAMRALKEKKHQMQQQQQQGAAQSQPKVNLFAACAVPGASQADFLERAAVNAANSVGSHAYPPTPTTPAPPAKGAAAAAAVAAALVEVVAAAPSPAPVPIPSPSLPLGSSAVGVLTPGVQSLWELFPALKSSPPTEGAMEGAGAVEATSDFIPPFAVTAAAKFFPPPLSPAFIVVPWEECSSSAGSSSSSSSSSSNSAHHLPSSPSSHSPHAPSSSNSSSTPKTPGFTSPQLSPLSPSLTPTFPTPCSLPTTLPITLPTRSLCPKAPHDRRVLALTFDAEGTPLKGGWGPGDVLGVWAPMHRDLVEGLVARLGVNGGGRVGVYSVGGGEDKGGRGGVAPLIPPWIPGYPYPTITDVLTWAVDFTSPPKKALLRMLGDSCSEAQDKDALYFLAGRSKAGLAGFEAFVERQYTSLLDLLHLFPSAAPTLPLLLTALPPLAPRFYSITTSPLATPAALGIAFNITSHTIGGGVGAPPIQRPGLATPWMEALTTTTTTTVDTTTATTTTTAVSPPPCVRVFVRPARTFLPPPSLETPVIMVSHGTGVSPFLSFLAHREARVARVRAASAAVCCGPWRRGLVLNMMKDDPEWQERVGPAVLFYGNRSPKEDWLFKEEVEAWRREGTLTAVHTAWSRAGSSGGGGGSGVGCGKVYVQDLVEGAGGGGEAGGHDGPLGWGQSLAHLLIRGGAHFYVCGKGAMANDVKAAVLSVLRAHGKDLGLEEAVLAAGAAIPAITTTTAVSPPKDPAEAFVKHLFACGRYAEDKWG